ncbi:MAG: DUF6377 domain-containing protein [Candidatus Cryptobacteroides sp.]
MRKIILIAVVLLSVSCGSRTEVERALDRLDKVIEQKDIYRRQFEENALSMRRNFEAAPVDSLKWECAQELFYVYNHYHADSCVRYLSLMEDYASDSHQELATRMAAIRIYFHSGDNTQSLNLFREVDTSGFDRRADSIYLSGARALYNYLWKTSITESEKAENRALLEHYLALSLERDSVSFTGLRIKAQKLRLEDRYDEALTIYTDLYDVLEDNVHTKASLAYNIATIYSLKGEQINHVLWLIKAADADFKAANRDYLALYELALLLEDSQVKRAERYISLNLTDVLGGNFSLRIPNSGRAQVVISEASRHISRVSITWLVVVLCFISLLCLVIIFLLAYSVRQHHRLRESQKTILSVNEKLKAANAELFDANRIKDNYVFRYMELSVNYLEKYDTFRHDVLKVAKSSGTDAVVKMLRSPSQIYSEYDNYYRIFDETFLALYPDFITKVNALMKDDAKFPETQDKVLPTELRILAVIRIGITQSGKIATFLKCSPATVYTYRTRLRNSSICPKDEFETIIRQL